MAGRIYPPKLYLNKTNAFDSEGPFFYLKLFKVPSSSGSLDTVGTLFSQKRGITLAIFNALPLKLTSTFSYGKDTVYQI